MKQLKKFIVLLQDVNKKEYYIQFFRASSRRNVCIARKNPLHRIEIVLDFNEVNLKKMKYHKETLNRLSRPHR